MNGCRHHPLGCPTSCALRPQQLPEYPPGTLLANLAELRRAGRQLVDEISAELRRLVER